MKPTAASTASNEAAVIKRAGGFAHDACSEFSCRICVHPRSSVAQKIFFEYRWAISIWFTYRGLAEAEMSREEI